MLRGRRSSTRAIHPMTRRRSALAMQIPDKDECFFDELMEYTHAERHENNRSDLTLHPQHWGEEELERRASATSLFGRFNESVDNFFEFLYEFKYINYVLWLLLIAVWVFILWAALSEDE